MVTLDDEEEDMEIIARTKQDLEDALIQLRLTYGAMGFVLNQLIVMNIGKLKDPKDVLAAVPLYCCIQHYKDITDTLGEAMTNEVIQGMDSGADTEIF